MLQLQEPKSEFALLLGLIAFVAILGNLSVCLTIMSDHRLRHSSNYFLVSLAVAYLLLALCIMIPDLIRHTMQRWPFGAEFCKVWVCLGIMFLTAITLSLCTIAVVKYVQIKDPIIYNEWMYVAKALEFIATVWVLAATISFVPVYLGWYRPSVPSSSNTTSKAGSENKQSTTGDKQEREDAQPLIGADNYEICAVKFSLAYTTAMSSVTFYVPGVIIIFCYSRIYELTKVRKDSRSLSESSSTCMAEHRRVSRSTVTLALISGCFFICWIPYYIVDFVNTTCSHCVHGLAVQVAKWLGFSNACISPFIYTLNRDYRRAFQGVLLRKFRQRSRAMSTYVIRKASVFTFRSSSVRPSTHRRSMVPTLKTVTVHPEQQPTAQ